MAQSLSQMFLHYKYSQAVTEGMWCLQGSLSGDVAAQVETFFLPQNFNDYLNFSTDILQGMLREIMRNWLNCAVGKLHWGRS